MNLDLREVSIQCDDAQLLVSLMDQELRLEYADEDMYEMDYDAFHASGGFFVVGYDGTTPVGCGGLRPMTGHNIELKRMFVRDSYRGRGAARQILEFLEQQAIQSGNVRMYLQTGDQQHAAIGLYRSVGYRPTATYGEYADGPRNRCFVKSLSPPSND